MKVSLITICYNNADTIEDTIQSVLDQTYDQIEYIFIDGGSTDETLKIIEKHRQPYFKVVSEKDNGIYDALNKGIMRATGEVVGMLHADDIFADTEVIEKVVELFKKTNADGVYGDLNYVDRINPTKIIRKWKSGKYKANKFLWGWMPPHPSFYVKKAVYDQFGVFNTELRSAADYELMLRFIHKEKIRIAYLEKTMVKMRVGGQSNVTLANRIKANKEDYRAWQLNGLHPFWITRFLKPLRKVSQYFIK